MAISWSDIRESQQKYPCLFELRMTQMEITAFLKRSQKPPAMRKPDSKSWDAWNSFRKVSRELG